MKQEFGYGWRSVVVPGATESNFVIKGDQAVQTLPSGLVMVVAADELFYRSEGEMARVLLFQSAAILSDQLQTMDYDGLQEYVSAVSCIDKGIHSDRLLGTLAVRERIIRHEGDRFLPQLYGTFDRYAFAWEMLAYQLGIDKDSLKAAAHGLRVNEAPFLSDTRFRERLEKEGKIREIDAESGRSYGLPGDSVHILNSGQVLVIG